MNNGSAARYLANIIAIARSNGLPDEREQAYLDQIRGHIHARKQDLKEAEKLAATEGYRPEPVERYSERVRNMEDIVCVCLLRGVLNDAQRQAIIAYANAARLSQRQTDLILSQSYAQAMAYKRAVVCPHCHREVEPMEERLKLS